MFGSLSQLTHKPFSKCGYGPGRSPVTLIPLLSYILGYMLKSTLEPRSVCSIRLEDLIVVTELGFSPQPTSASPPEFGIRCNRSFLVAQITTLIEIRKTE